MKRVGAIIVLCLLMTPLISLAKGPKIAGYFHDKGRDIEVGDSLGWPVSIKTSDYIESKVQTLPDMAVLKFVGYNPWWRLWGDVPATTTVTVSGLPASTTLHVYTRGYREHAEMHTDAQGTLKLEFRSEPGTQFIIKTKPSTYHIDASAGGGDCDGDPGILGIGKQSPIGTWNATTKTCKLFTDVYETISIDGSDITLDGSGKSVFGPGSGDGIYTDESNVTIKNIEVHRFARAIVYSDSLFTAANGGLVSNVTVSEGNQGIVDEGISYLKITDANIVTFGTGIALVDQIDGHATDNIVITRNNFKQNGVDIANDGTSFALSNSAERGNWWEKNADCKQDSVKHNECTNSYSAGPGTDAEPWACESGWRSGVTCPFTQSGNPPPPPPPPGPTPPPTGSWGEVKTSSGTASLYSDRAMGTKIKTLPNEWALKVIDSSDDPVKVHDSTDGVDGYIKSGDFDISASGSTRENELRENSEIIYDTRAKRIPVILNSVDAFYAKDNGSKTLFDPAGGLDGRDNFKELSDNINFPKELILAIIADETGGNAHLFSNEICNDSLDGGIGIMQLTIYYNSRGGYSDPKGLGGGMNTPSKKDDCRGASGWEATSSNYYSNSRQGIFANIKDGLRVLQSKYESAPVSVALASSTDNWFTKDGLTITKKDMGSILTIRGYRGFGGTICQRLNIDQEYPGLIANLLPKINNYFPSINYTDSEHNNLAAKLKLAEDNKDKIMTCSPVYLQIMNGSEIAAGFDGTNVVNKTGEVVYDDIGHNHADIFFNPGYYTYRVIGTATGTYDMFVDSKKNGVLRTFEAVDIPTKVGEMHEYTLDWSALMAGKNGVTIRIDSSGDGVFERILKTDRVFSAAEFSAKVTETNKSIVCHIPPGNPSNAHTLSLPASAIGAHLAHGDKLGNCPVVLDESDNSTAGPKDDKSDKIPPGQIKKKNK